jgi:hypothetical protein
MKRKFICIAILCVTTFSIPLQAQVLRDTATLRLICKEVDCIYDFKFTQANDIYHSIKSTYPEHPITYILRGLLTYWESYPLTVTSPGRISFESDMRHAIELSEKKSHTSDAGEYLLCNLGARGLLLLFYADNDQNMEVISLASGTYSLLRKSFDYTNSYADFYFFTGLYNYYREAYPEAHPVYRPLARLFPKGDIAKGLKELGLASRGAIVLKGEAFSFLNLICINYENNFKEASLYAKSLYELYPANIQYYADYVKNLLLIKDYDEAEKLLNAGKSKISNVFVLAQFTVYEGIVAEKKYHKLMEAEELYKKGIRDISPFGPVGNEISAYAYFGLSRISDENDVKHYRKLYRKQALELTSYKKINFDE